MEQLKKMEVKESEMSKVWWILGVVVILGVFTTVLKSEEKQSPSVLPEEWVDEVALDVPQIAEGWSEPVLVVGGVKVSVGEPTLTADGKRLFYEQVFERNVDGKPVRTTQFFYVEKEE